MIAVAGDHIVAGDTSLTGSIGVIFQYGQVKPLLDKLGVSLEEIKSAPMKAEPSPFHAPPPESLEAIRGTVMDSFDWFVTLVSERRKLSREDTLKLADGRIFTGRQAKEVKLIDALGGEAEMRDYFKGRKVAADLRSSNGAPRKKRRCSASAPWRGNCWEWSASIGRSISNPSGS